MKASELITKLQQMIEEHGDLECSCYDGLDPSDLEIVTDVVVDNYRGAFGLRDGRMEVITPTFKIE